MPAALTCLLVDDDQDDQEIFNLALVDSGLKMKCVISSSAVEALAMLTQENTTLPDYIFLDLNMPRINGIQFLTEVKKNSSLQKNSSSYLFNFFTSERYRSYKKTGSHRLHYQTVRNQRAVSIIK